MRMHPDYTCECESTRNVRKMINDRRKEDPVPAGLRCYERRCDFPTFVWDPYSCMCEYPIRCMIGCMGPDMELALDGCRCISKEENQAIVDAYNEKWDQIEEEQRWATTQSEGYWEALWEVLRDYFSQSNAHELGVSSSLFIVSLGAY